MTWSHDRYCDAIGPEIDRMAAAATGVAPGTPVPTCPDWTLAVLLEHMGAVHRWAGTMVTQLSPRRVNRADLDLGLPADERDLPAWLAAGAEPLLASFRNADPDAAMWAWGTDRHVRFWPRRMLHETCIHRVDAERTAGVASEVDPEVASDGIEELLGNLLSAARFAPSIEELRGNGETLTFEATDIGVRWLITREPGGFHWGRDDGAAHASVGGQVADLYLVLYRRLPTDHPGMKLAGDQAIVDHWFANAKI
ncbi:MAG: maleylpyruvate isomerase family mycothiol-dependent enzyme [Acidimicrobiales bacterium]